MPRRVAATAALLLAATVARAGADAAAAQRHAAGVVVLPVGRRAAADGLEAPMVLMHDTLAREVSRGAGGAPPLTTETPLVDFCREVLRTPHPVLVEAAPPAEAPPRCGGGSWVRAIGWALCLAAALVAAALNYAAARLWLRVLAPAVAAAARGAGLVAATALAPAAAAAAVASAAARAAGSAAMLSIEAVSCGMQLARESLRFLAAAPTPDGAPREMPPTLRGALRNATAALEDADGAALHAAVARRLRPLAPLRSLAETGCRLAFAPPRAAMSLLLHRRREAPAAAVATKAAAEPLFVPAGSRVDGNSSASDEASPRVTSPRTADTRGPLHGPLSRLQHRRSAA